MIDLNANPDVKIADLPIGEQFIGKDGQTYQVTNKQEAGGVVVTVYVDVKTDQGTV